MGSTLHANIQHGGLRGQPRQAKSKRTWLLPQLRRYIILNLLLIDHLIFSETLSELCHGSKYDSLKHA